MEKVESWRAALTEAANLSGWDLQNIADGHESKFIQKIVEEILCKVNHTFLNVAVHPVGIHSRIEEINVMLSIGSDDVRMIGIYGMGGIGKTTVAKAVYNQFFLQFEGSCFLANVREVAGQLNGLVRLQEQLLCELLKKKNLKIDNVDRGMNVIKERLRSKRALIVLDDLDQLCQLNALAGNRGWFGSGSRIIITTRDEHLLKELKIDEKYKAKELNPTESLQLLSWHAFRETKPLETYAELANGIVSYSEGLPLALEVLGSYLFGRSMLEWKSAFEKLQQIPPNQIQMKLRISFDALDDDKMKDIFLDIACFFIGTDKDYAITILNGCGFFSEIGISILISRCLLTINENNELRMHDLLRDMGREIIREESPKDPGKRSRLWFHEDVCHVLEKYKGTEAVEGVILALPSWKVIQWSTEAFAKMHNLRLLQINHVHLIGNFKHLSEELRWLCWHNCPLKYLPSNFHLEKVVILDLQFSKMKILCQGVKYFGSLKILNLSHSEQLTKTPDFSGLPRLEKLLLKRCTGLIELHASIGLLERLVYLTLKGCKNLKYLPGNICKLKSLQNLNLTGCSKLEELPEHLGHMESLTELLADGTAIRQLPFSLGLLKNLTSLSLKGCRRQFPNKSWLSLISSWVSPRKSPDSIRFLPSSVSGLCSLKRLFLSDCNLFDGDIPVDLGSLSSLEELDLARNNFHRLPCNFNYLSKLETLRLHHCTNLQILPELPPNLKDLHANDCTSVETLSNFSNLNSTPSLFLSNCNRLTEIQGLENLGNVRIVHMEGCNSLANTFKDTLFKGQPDYGQSDIFLPGSELPSWFSVQIAGCSIPFDVPLHLADGIEGIALGAVYAAPEESGSLTAAPHAIISDKTNGVEWTYRPTFFGIPITPEDHVWFSHIPESQFGYPVRGGEQMEVSIRIGLPARVKKCGIHIICKRHAKDNTDSDMNETLAIVHVKREREVDSGQICGDFFAEENTPKRSKKEVDRNYEVPQ